MFYDGTCGFCDRFVQLALRHDRDQVWRFSPLQSNFAAQQLARFGVTAADLDSLHAIRDVGQPTEQLLSSSAACVFLWCHLHGWPSMIGRMFALTPHFIRETAYRFIARNRYRLFGRYGTCKLPTAAEAERFILDSSAAVEESARGPNTAGTTSTKRDTPSTTY